MKHFYKKKKGFAFSLLLISLPVFITCLTIFTALLFCIRNHNLAQKICIEQTLQAQTQQQTYMESLFLLNPLAKQLKRSYQQVSRLLKKAIKAKEPFTISILLTQREILRQKRWALDRAQKAILKQSRKAVENTFTQFKQKMHKLKASWIRKKHNKPFALAVKARPKRDIAPVYYTPRDFSKKQALILNWKMPLYQFIPEWIQKIFFKPELSAYSCSATLKKKDKNGKLSWLFEKENTEYDTLFV